MFIHAISTEMTSLLSPIAKTSLRNFTQTGASDVYLIGVHGVAKNIFQNVILYRFQVSHHRSKEPSRKCHGICNIFYRNSRFDTPALLFIERKCSPQWSEHLVVSSSCLQSRGRRDRTSQYNLDKCDEVRVFVYA